MSRFGGGAPRTVEVPLVCTLQELAKGATKKRKITRHVLRNGKPQPKEVCTCLCLPRQDIYAYAFVPWDTLS